ncbi:MAG TPA: glycosyltransferase [bacterium]|nr:glycosyltransferase [bacterium]
MIKVSINCLAYNHEKYIKDALDGFLSQKTDFEYEVLIHDDASTDKTADIIREYEKRYPHIIKPIYQTENQYSKGIRPTFAYNLPRAQGRYIALCEGDDYWTDPLKLQKQVDLLEKDPAVAVCAHNYDIRTMRPDGSSFMERPLCRIAARSYSTAEIIAKGMFVKTASLVFRRALIEEMLADIEYHLGFRVGDYPLLFFLSTKGPLHVLEESMSVYRKNLSSAWNPLDARKKFLVSIETYERLLSRYPDFRKELERRISVCRMFLLKSLLDTGDLSQFLETLRKDIAASSSPSYACICHLAYFLIVRYLVDAISFGIRKVRRIGAILFSLFLPRGSA